MSGRSPTESPDDRARFEETRARWRASHGLPPAPPLPELNLPDLLEDGAEDPDKPPEFLQDLNELSREKVLFRDAVLGQMISILIGKSKPNALLTAGSPAYQKVARMLKPALARGRIRVIGSTTSQEVRDLETDPAFNRRFTRVLVDELSAAQTVEILRDIYRTQIAEIRSLQPSVPLPDELGGPDAAALADRYYNPALGARPAEKAVTWYIDSLLVP